jgi:uncharacterized membrane protein YoaK (UPF0700 family)
MVDSLDGVQLGARELTSTSIKTSSLDSIKALRLQHHCVSSIGGFLGAYAIINHHDMLAAAQTSNLINLVLALLGGDIPKFLARVGALVVYVFGFFMTIYIPRYTKFNLQSFSLCVDILAIIIMAILPEDTNDVVALYPVFFAMAIQWNSFLKIGEYSSSTIFSTNNTKMATMSLIEYFLDNKQDKSKLDKSKFLGATILGYHLGVALAFYSCKFLGTTGILMCFLPVIVSLVSHIRVRRSTN